MPAKPSEARMGSEKPEKKLFVFFVDPAKDPDIFEKLSSVRPVAKYLRQVELARGKIWRFIRLQGTMLLRKHLRPLTENQTGKCFGRIFPCCLSRRGYP